MPRKAANVGERESVAEPKKRVRRAPTKKAVAKEAKVVVASRPRRKAPTRVSTSVAQTPTSRGRIPKVVVIAALVFCVIGGTSVAVGMQDSGRIDVIGAIEQRNEQVVAQAQEGESVQMVSVPKHDPVANVPNGGLRGKGSEGTPVPEVLAAETASTTESTSSTTTAETLPDEATEPSSEAASEAVSTEPAS